MPRGRPYRLSFPAQLLATAIIVAALCGVARLSSSAEDARAFDEAAEETRFQLEGAARGITTDDPVVDELQMPAEREEP